MAFIWLRGNDAHPSRWAVVTRDEREAYDRTGLLPEWLKESEERRAGLPLRPDADASRAGRKERPYR